MRIFDKGSTIDSTSNNPSSVSSRSRRNSSSSVPSNSAPVSIVPAPSQGPSFIKPTPGGNLSGSGVFGRQNSWTDQLADASLLKGNSTVPARHSSVSYPSAIPASHNANILYGNGNGSSPSISGQNGNNDVKFVHSTMEILENQIKREEAPKKKRTRTSTEQLRILQKAFQTDPMPNSTARMTLSKKLGMSSRAVQVWFQNRRAKEKLDAKRNSLGLSGESGFAYIKGNSDDDLDGDFGQDEDGEYNFDDDQSSINDGSNGNESSSGGSVKSSGEFLNSMKANGMMGRMAFNSNAGIEGPIKSQRSYSTPNGFFQGNSHNNQNASSFNNSSNSRFFGASKSFPSSSYGQHLSSNNPLCQFFPGETFISDVNEASVDQLYQDLGGIGSIPSPIDESGLLSSQNLGISGFPSNSSSSSSNSGSSSSSFFTFGDPFYGGGGIIDRTPSVSPVGFGPRSHFFHSIGSSFDFMLPISSNTPEFVDQMTSNSLPSSVNSSNACKGLSGGNVYLTSSFGSSLNNSAVSSSSSNSNRRSYSLPEAHVNSSFNNMQQLENFGLDVFPSPLLSINEEESASPCNLNLKSDSIINTTTSTTTLTTTTTTTTTNNNNNNNNNNNEIESESSSVNNPIEFMIPFSDFLEGEVIR